MDRWTFFADVVKASFEDFERADVVEASYENFERSWVCCGLFFKISYVILNIIIVVGGSILRKPLSLLEGAV